MTFVVLVTGGRDYEDAGRVYGVLSWLHAQVGLTGVVQGLATGADHHACMWAHRNRVPQRQFGIMWLTDGEENGPKKRNRRMWRETRKQVDMVIGFPGGSGTRDMIEIAREAQAAGTWQGHIHLIDLEQWKIKP